MFPIRPIFNNFAKAACVLAGSSLLNASSPGKPVAAPVSTNELPTHPALAQFAQKAKKAPIEISTTKLNGTALCAKLQEQLPIFNQNVKELQQRAFENSHGQSGNSSEAPAPKLDLRRADLTGCNLSSRDLEGAVLTEANLSGTNLSSSNLSKVNLRGANLQKATLDGANLWEVEASNANLTEASLRSADIKGGSLQEANLQRANLTGATLTRVNLNASNFDGANLSTTIFDPQNTLQASLQNTNFSRATFGTHSAGSPDTLRGANLSGANLSFANLKNYSLIDNDLTGANLENTNLEDSILYKNNFSEANFSLVNLKNSILVGNSLTLAQVNSALFLQGAAVDVSLESLRGANKISQEQVREKVLNPDYGTASSADENTRTNPAAITSKDVREITKKIKYLVNHEGERKPN